MKSILSYFILATLLILFSSVVENQQRLNKFSAIQGHNSTAVSVRK